MMATPATGTRVATCSDAVAADGRGRRGRPGGSCGRGGSDRRLRGRGRRRRGRRGPDDSPWPREIEAQDAEPAAAIASRRRPPVPTVLHSHRRSGRRPDPVVPARSPISWTPSVAVMSTRSSARAGVASDDATTRSAEGDAATRSSALSDRERVAAITGRIEVRDVGHDAVASEGEKARRFRGIVDGPDVDLGAERVRGGHARDASPASRRRSSAESARRRHPREAAAPSRLEGLNERRHLAGRAAGRELGRGGANALHDARRARPRARCEPARRAPWRRRRR